MEEMYLQVPLKQLLLSKTNPRKHNTNGQDLEDLAASIKSHGILQPILVRPLNPEIAPGKGKYEIISGERRYRAAAIADLTEVPVLARDMSDDAVIEVQIIENLQRKDIHPMDEAEGFNVLLQKGSLSKEMIAEKLGKPLNYIYKRLQLVTLSEDLKKAFLEDKFSLAHAIEFSRLNARQQSEMWDWFKKQGEYNRRASDLRYNIQGTYHLKIKDAVFNPDDELLTGYLPTKHLYHNAPACSKCPKRTGFNKNLFDDIEAADSCTDPQCFKAKISAYILELKQKYFDKTGVNLVEVKYSNMGAYRINEKGHPEAKEAKKKCSDTRNAIIISVPSWEKIKVGKIIKICDNPKCKVHWTKSDRENVGTEQAKPTAKQIEKEEKAKFEREVNEASLRRAAMAVGAKLKWPLDNEIMDRLLVDMCEGGGWYEDNIAEMAEDRNLLKSNDLGYIDSNQLMKLFEGKKQIEKLRLIGELTLRMAGEKFITKMAKKFKVDINKIKKEVRAELKAEQEEENKKADNAND